METLSMCRICLVKDVNQHTIDKNLQEIYEKLTTTPFQARDNRPLKLCYICYARLRNCYRLQTSCLRSEQLFSLILANNELKPLLLQHVNTMRIVHPIIHLNCVPTPWNDGDDDNEDHRADVDPLEIKADIHVKEENIEDAHDNIIDQEADNQYTKPEDIIKAEEMKVEDNDTSNFSIHIVEEDNTGFKDNELDIDENAITEDGIEASELEDEIDSRDVDGSTKDPNEKVNFKQLYESVLLKSVKIVLNKVDMDCFNTTAQIPKLLVIRENISSNKPETDERCEENRNTTIYTNKPRLKKKLNNSSKPNMHSVAKTHICDVCERVFKSKSVLINHIRIHTGERPYRCDICDKRFRVSSGLSKHIHTHVRVKPFKCDTYDECFRTKKALAKHIHKHSDAKAKYRCKVCKKIFIEKRGLDLHIRIHTDERPFKCDICEKSFRQKAHLNNHIGIHTSEKIYTCDVCKKCFGGKGVLVKHMRIHRSKKPYRCDQCDKCFIQKSHLFDHISIHSGEKTNQCSVCGKCFNRKANLISHYRTHTGEKPYKCNVCKTGFSRKSHLIGHIRTHGGEKPFKCDVCGKCFRRKDHLIGHCRMHQRKKSKTL